MIYINPLVDGIGSASWLELAWSLVCIVGAAYGYTAWRFMRQREALMWRRGLNGANEIQARKNVRDELGRLVTSAIYLVIGLAAMLTPPRPDYSGGTAVISALLAGGLIGAQAYNVWLSVLARRDNYRVLNLVLGESARPKRKGKR